jgi:preprotein translocase subunit SecG
METVLIVIHLMIVIALVAVVMLQRSEGGALGIGGGSGFMTGRGQANALTRATAWLGAAFFFTSIALTVLANTQRAPRSVFDQVQPQQQQSVPGQPPAGGSLFDQLQRQEQTAPAPAPAPGGAPQPRP